MHTANADRNLLFGILSLQMDFIKREQLIEAMNTWVLDKLKPLSEILVQCGALEQSDCDLLKPMVDRHVEIHQDDAEKSLATLSSIGSLRDQLKSIADSDVEQSLGHVAAAQSEDDLSNTVSFTGASTSEGQRFRILRFHAKGGLGIVSVALDNELHREVALKEIQPQAADNLDNRTRFVREAEITGSLEHPGIVPVYGLGQYSDGRPFYAMRFIHGDSLKVAIEHFHKADKRDRDPGERTLKLRKLLGRFIDVCNAVEYAHSRGVLHRDLKPSNIMLGKHGETLVVDWGLAKSIGRSATRSGLEEPTIRPSADSGSAPTLMGSVVGTPAFMSPEQAGGRLDLLGPASDVYSLGATLYTLLTGRPPFDAKTPEILKLVERGDFPRPRDVNSQVPAALEAISVKAMARQQADRYASPLELAEELELWLADEAVRAWREPISVRLRRRIKRHRTVAVGTTTAAVLLIVGLCTFGLLRWHRLDVIRQQVESHVAQGIVATQAGDVESAISSFSQAAGSCRSEPSLTAMHQRVTHRLEQLQQYRQFRQLAQATLREGVHALRKAEGSDPLVEQAEQALAIYGGLEHPQWDNALSDTVLTDAQIADTKALIAELINMVGIRLAMYDTKDDAGHKATKRALELFALAERLKPPTAGIWMARMLFNRRLGNDGAADNAGERMTSLVKSGEMTGTDHYLIGIFTLRVIKNPKAAMTMFQQAVAKDPKNYGAYFGMYLASRELKDVSGQIQALTACMVLRPRMAELYYFRGFVYFEQGKFRLAHLDFGGCTERNPDYAVGHYWRGRTHIMRDQWSKAERDFSRALEIDPELISPYSWRALARGKLDRYRESVKDAERSLQISDNDSTRWRCARAYAQSARAVLDDRAESDRQTLSERFGDRAVELLRTMADGGYFKKGSNLVSLLSKDLDPLRERDDFQQLAAQLVEPIMTNPALARSPNLLLLRSTVLAQRGQHKAAAEAAERLYRLADRFGRIPGVNKQRLAGNLYNAACCFSLCVPAVALTKSPSGEKRQRTSSELTDEEKAIQSRYRDQAIKALELSVRRGYSNVAHMKQDRDLDAIRHDQRFQKLIEKLEEKAEAEVGSSESKE